MIRNRLNATLGVGALVLLGLVVAGVLIFLWRANRLVERAVEAHFERSTGTDVSVGRVTLKPADSRATLTGFTIGNPPGYDTDYALSVDQVSVELDLRSIASDPLVIRSIAVRAATLNAEQRGRSLNVSDILNHVHGSEPAPQNDEGHVVVDSFLLEDAHIVISAPSLRAPQTLALEPVSVRDIGRSAGGVSYDEATDELLTAIFAAARVAMTERVEDAARSAVRDDAEEALRDRLEKLRD